MSAPGVQCPPNTAQTAAVPARTNTSTTTSSQCQTQHDSVLVPVLLLLRWCGAKLGWMRRCEESLVNACVHYYLHLYAESHITMTSHNNPT